MIEPFCKIVERGDDLQIAITKLLDLDTPFPQMLVERAKIDDVFARLLYKASIEKDLIPTILKISGYDVPKMTDPNRYSNIELVKNGVKSFVKWGLSGFPTVPQELINTRVSICQACPNLAKAADKLLYKIKFSKSENTNICSLCGCVVARKATLPGETCPAKKW